MVAVNLLNWRQGARRRMLKRWLWLSVTLLLLAQLALLLCWQLLADNTQRWQRQLTLWQLATTQAQQLSQRFEKARSQQHTLRTQAALRQQKRQRLTQWQAFILQLENSMPDEVWLSSLTHQQQILQLEGLSLRPEATRQLHRRLRKSDSFSSWRPGTLKKRADGLYHFTLATGKTEGAANEE